MASQSQTDREQLARSEQQLAEAQGQLTDLKNQLISYQEKLREQKEMNELHETQLKALSEDGAKMKEEVIDKKETITRLELEAEKH